MVDGPARTPSVPGTVYFDSVDVVRAREILNRFYPPMSIGIPDGGELKLGVEMIQLGPLTVGHLTFEGSATLVSPQTEAYHVTLPTAGLVRARRDGREITATPATALAFRPGDRMHTRHEPHSAEIDVRIEQWALESELAGLLGHPVEGPIDLAPTFDLTGGPAYSWSRLVRLLHDELEHETSLIHQPLIAEQLCSSVLSGLLLSVPHRYHQELVSPAGSGPPRAVQRAVEAIHEEPERAFTVRDLARIAGVSVRSLQEGFRRHVGCAPMTYLQQLRLNRVRETLLEGDPARVTVAAVAHRWGFAHLGRFASAYRERFGESPSETLRQPG
ncbi:AraC-like DNA-binding protein/DNA-binding transcriptional ArsR family regulator [Actinoplanes lutulentus]|uniref:AraC-like DNA-binding protein n=1 Tax=Actinoplanes lutulentus TaxID=1287878 RepID=A0A327Z9I6_9ACTN|nr:AraC family transcriptional regulator [Actinoplanes lutulentus]MBB2946243.1 AraC-like DNA-binding protein/DNA-binding transcriptional ArsR family regulator [Actinoplanes lutulentus]RAK32931.1 AraC-like DNA-binding protein [Actinoplanes lutulentus]